MLGWMKKGEARPVVEISA